MPRTRPSRRLIAARKSEEGYIMLTAIFFMALLALSLTLAAPRVARSIQREREVETFHRGMQYRRAIQLYYRQFHAYPPTIDALNKSNNMRFLRKPYLDPMTRKTDWKPVMYGQNKTPTAMGFFGQPLSGNASTIAGVGPSGGNNNSAFGSLGSSGSSSGSSSAMGSIFSSSGSDNGTPPAPATGASGASGATGAAGSASTAGSSGSDSGSSNGQTFGGAGIIGFSPGSTAQSILSYKKKNHFNEWEFTYDPISDAPSISGGNTNAIGQPAGSTTTPVGASPFGPSPTGNSGSPNGPAPASGPPSTDSNP